MNETTKTKRNVQRSLALSLFLTLGNAQEDALPVSTVYATQGNVARRQSMDEAEMQAAVQAARQDKALKAAMATYSPQQQVITTPAQFLAANPPRVPAARNGETNVSGSLLRKNEEVPEFEPVPGASNTAMAPRNAASLETGPPAKVGFFEKLKAMNRKKTSGYAENPYAMEQPAPPESISNTGDAVSGASVKKEAFGGIFKRGKGSPAPAGELVGGSSVAPVPGGISVGSAAPAIRAEDTAVPNMGTRTGMTEPEASIFIPRESGTLSGEVVSLKSTADADVGGVMVSIREGTQVGILSERGGVATIQLPDQRVGTIKSSALTR